MSLKKRIWEVLEVADSGDRVSRYYDAAMMTLIVLNVLAVIAISVPGVRRSHGASLELFELVSVIVFTVEYVVRVWAVTSSPDHSAPIAGRLRFVLTPLLLIDLVAIAPFYIQFAVGDSFALESWTFLRIFRILRLSRYVASLRMLGQVLRERADELLVSLLVLMLLLVVASTLMYFAERKDNEHFSSIPESMWWGVTTLTTVGYGDVYPVTTLGKLFAAVIEILGIGMFALPTSILGAGFVEKIGEVKKRRREAKEAAERAKREAAGGVSAEKASPRCPHCGKTLPAP